MQRPAVHWRFLSLSLWLKLTNQQTAPDWGIELLHDTGAEFVGELPTGSWLLVNDPVLRVLNGTITGAPAGPRWATGACIHVLRPSFTCADGNVHDKKLMRIFLLLRSWTVRLKLPQFEGH
ncbi:hypothetical protein AAFF_G00242040 [Aldrovandia affinis]|uniref:Secreted protein n=1 Tax=Aldrovandia affinis TaxID=143900 RepID=A0AAD7WU68_9TELE|nr:hypothetical protein AAFF_G00242040 [Aldrovandia affinis]